MMLSKPVNGLISVRAGVGRLLSERPLTLVATPLGDVRLVVTFRPSVRSLLQEKAKPVPSGRIFSSDFFIKKLQGERGAVRRCPPLRRKVTGDALPWGAERDRAGREAGGRPAPGACILADTGCVSKWG